MIYNVRDYGATGDGVTNDKMAIQAAVDAARAAGGGEVYIPAGTYIVTGYTSDPSAGCIMLYDNITVTGDGMGATTVKLQDGWAGDITGIFRDPYGAGTENLTVRDLTIDGNRDSVTGKIIGWFNGGAPGTPITDVNVTLERVEVKDCTSYGFDPHEITIDLVIRDCVSHGNGLDGFALDYLIDSVIENCVAYDNDRHGFNVVTSTSDTQLLNNIAYGNGGNGIIVQRGGEDIAVPDNILIQGGEVYGNTLDGVHINMANRITIEGIDIHDNGQRGIRIRGSLDSIVRDNYLHDNSQSKHLGYDEISIAGNDDTAGVSGRIYFTTGTLVTGNTITETKAVHALYSVRETGSYVDYTLVSNNLIQGTANNNNPLLIGPNSAFEPYNSPPVAQADDFVTPSGQGLSGNVLADNGQGADSDPNGDPLSVIAFSGQTAAGGSVTLSASGGFSYTARSGFTGPDSFSYTLRDGRGGTDTAVVSITVVAPGTNLPPVARADSFSVAFNQALAGNVLANNGQGADSDPNGDPLSVTPLSVTTAGGGSVSLSANGSFTYTPQFGYAGADSFSYTLLDGRGGTDTAAVSLSVLPPPGAVTGTNGNDTIIGNSQNNVLLGLGGADSLSGSSGSDTLYGGSGNDILGGGTGNDTLYGCDGGDILNGNDGDDLLQAGSLASVLSGGGQNDTLYGGAGNDTLSGNSGNDTLYGSAGSDKLNGNDGDDILYAGPGSSSLSGGGGNDTLIAGASAATITGNAGADIFMFASAAGVDTVTDFRSRYGDKIDISGILDYDASTDSIADFLRATSQGGATTLSVDVDGAAGGSLFTTLAVFQKVSSFDIDAMISQGNLVV